MARRASKEQREETFQRNKERKMRNQIRKRRLKTSLKRMERIAENLQYQDDKERLKQHFEVVEHNRWLVEVAEENAAKLEAAKEELQQIANRLEREENGELEFE